MSKNQDRSKDDLFCIIDPDSDGNDETEFDEVSVSINDKWNTFE